MAKNKFYLIVIFSFLLQSLISAQDPGQTWSSNITLKCVTDYGRGGGADVWGWNQNGVDYALVILNGGLSIVNTSDPSSPTEKVHINHSNLNKKLEVGDIETFTSNGTTYAYLSVHRNDSTYFVLIINLNEAINSNDFIGINPDSLNSVYVGRIQNPVRYDIFPREIAWQAHTLTIEGGYLYVATLKDKIPVWNLNSSPTNPTYLGAITLTPNNTEVHEMYVKSTGSNTSKIYAACSRGGLQVIDLNLSNMTFTKTSQMYDADKKYANLINSSDPLFDFRQTHSAWPTDDGQYIFTTDELSIWAPNGADNQINFDTDANLYNEPNILHDVHRQGAFMRTWKTSQLGTSNALKNGFYVPEGQQQGITELSSINNNMVPSSIHQMYGKEHVLYVSHYSQGLRVLDISNPENIIEVSYYDDRPTMNTTIGDENFFRKNTNNWYQGIYGMYPDPNRPGIVYAGSWNNGLYIFDVLPNITAPTGFSLSGSTGGNPTLTWNANTDAGLDGYKIYQNLDNSGYVLLVTLDRNVTSFTDNGVIIGNGKFDPSVCYYITAFNITGRESNPSLPKCTGFSGLNKSAESNDAEESPKEYSLFSAYPNPFNPTTQISYQLPKNSFVNLTIYNSLGQIVETLVDKNQTTGYYTIEFNADNLPSGLYIYKIQAGNFFDIKKMILLK